MTVRFSGRVADGAAGDASALVPELPALAIILLLRYRSQRILQTTWRTRDRPHAVSTNLGPAFDCQAPCRPPFPARGRCWPRPPACSGAGRSTRHDHRPPASLVPRPIRRRSTSPRPHLDVLRPALPGIQPVQLGRTQCRTEHVSKGSIALKGESARPTSTRV